MNNKNMNYDEMLHWLIFRSPKRTAKSAAELLHIHPVQFGQWRNWKKSNCTPTDSQCVKIAEILELNPFHVWLTVQSVKTKNPVLQAAINCNLQQINTPHVISGRAQ